jgi:DNA-binding transcriptional ArsR family regulator
MVRTRVEEEPPELQSVLDALDDPDCRTIVRRLHEPMTASEVSTECDIPMSTTYRKLDTLSEASLVEERTEIRSDGHHASQYLVAFDAVSVVRTDDGALEVTVERPDQTAEERLASIWTEVRREA